MSEKELKGFIDIRCDKCGTKIGWFGTLSQQPPCRNCGSIYEIDVSKTEKALLDNECFCHIQDLLYNHKSRLEPLELKFIRHMYTKHRAKEEFSSKQVFNIKRIYKRRGK